MNKCFQNNVTSNDDYRIFHIHIQEIFDRFDSKILAIKCSYPKIRVKMKVMHVCMYVKLYLEDFLPCL